MKFTSILVPFDKSDHALHALTLAKGLAEEDPPSSCTSSGSCSSPTSRLR